MHSSLSVSAVGPVGPIAATGHVCRHASYPDTRTCSAGDIGLADFPVSAARAT